ncbi:MAG: hypothetical protein ACYTGB_03410 [Planctomycetota bacterium]|jgi:hypothetical protein
MTRPTLFGERFLPPEPEGPVGPPEEMDAGTGRKLTLIGVMGLTLAASGAVILLAAGATVTHTRGASRSARIRYESARAQMREQIREARELEAAEAREESDEDGEGERDEEAPAR